MTQEALKKMYQLLLTEPHAPNVCAQLERIAREALAEHAMQQVQRLGREIEQEPVAWVSEDVCKGQYIDGRPRKIWWECEKGVGTAFYTTPPQRTEQEPVAWPCHIIEADFSERTITLGMECGDYKVSAGTHYLSTTPPKE
jgi:hypothetical protein